MVFLQETSLSQWELSGVQNSWDELRRTSRRWERLISVRMREWMKTVEKNLLRWHVRRDGMRWEELRCGERRREELRCGLSKVWSVKCKCEVWRVQCEVWGKCLLGVALRQGRAGAMFLDNICATASHKARTHGPGWRTAHANSIWKRAFRKATSAPLRATKFAQSTSQFYFVLQSLHTILSQHYFVLERLHTRGTKQPWRSHDNAICRHWIAKHNRTTRNGVGTCSSKTGSRRQSDKKTTYYEALFKRTLKRKLAISSCKRQSCYACNRGTKQPWRRHYIAICKYWIAKRKRNTRNCDGNCSSKTKPMQHSCSHYNAFRSIT